MHALASHSLINRRHNLSDSTVPNRRRTNHQYVEISVPRNLRLPEGCDDIKIMSKLLLNVTFQRSLGAMQVVISTDATVGDLIRSAVEMYLREKRRPLLTEPVDTLSFELHYSPFSFECLDPGQKLLRMTSRNCFLCTKPAAAAAASTSTSSSSCSYEGKKIISASQSSFSFTELMDYLL